MTVPVSVVSCLYGDGHYRFVSEWCHAIRQLDPRPEDVIVMADRAYDIPCAHVFVADCDWRHPQAYYLQQAFDLALTPWVWILDVDDLALPDALDGIEDVTADVLMMGYVRDGETYVPPPMTAAGILAAAGNHVPGASAVRVEAFRRAGGFPDVAFQDWGLWRRLAACGATFEPSPRPGFLYRGHRQARTHVELTWDARERHLAEMYESERVLVA